MTAHRGVVLHIAEGYYAGTVSWLLNQISETSAHFVVSRDGEITQLVDTDRQSWCQVGGNSEWLSIENAGFSGEELTDAQVSACARILARAHQEYGIPLQLANSPSGRGLGYHAMGGAGWGNHPNCPGAGIIAQRSGIIRLAGGAATAGGDGMSDANFVASHVPVMVGGKATGAVQGAHVALGDILAGVQQLLARPATMAEGIDYGKLGVAVAEALIKQLGGK
jgi:hypothetical protein